ncbi:MAG: QcrA and Rieske domain-containing protein [Acidimicrobiales bacterium]
MSQETTAPPASSSEIAPLAAFDDPHHQPYAKNPRRAELVVGLCLFIGLLGFAAYGGVYWVGGQTRLEGLFLGLGLFGFGFGMSAWGKYLLPRGPFSEERHPVHGTEEELQALSAAVTDRGRLVVRRRGFLGGLLGAGAGVMGIVLAFPLLRSLGPQPKKGLETTNWKSGMHLVDITGRPLHASDLAEGSSLTVFPQGFVGSAIDQTMLIRAATSDIVTKPGRETWGPQGYVAYSKLCTHAGCPVGLYQEQTQQLLCPCHQSIFGVLDGAQQEFGPAPRPLPQLPLMIDSDGWIRAQRGFSEPVGPGFWERS